MNTSSDSDIKKIYEKSVRLLNDKQARLMDMRQVLKKAVIRLSLASRSNNDQVNNVLNDIKASVDDHVDLEQLSKNLDNLFVLINHSDYHAEPCENKAFYLSLEENIKKCKNSPVKAEYVSKLKALTSKKLSDDDMSLELLQLMEDFSESKQHHVNGIKLLIKEITESTDFKFNGDIESSGIMQELAIEIVKYIYEINDKKLNDRSYKINVNHVLTEMVNQLTLPFSSKKDQEELTKLLSKPDDNNERWQDVTQKLVMLVNKSICSIEEEKRELESYLTKISLQLEDIESYIHGVRRDSDEVKSRSIALSETVESGVIEIENTVSTSTDLETLKKHVSENLCEIRKHVVDFSRIDVNKEEASAQEYAQMMEELSKTQKESKKLKEQLHVSKIQLLRDPLTHIPNRLAYDERITVEYNRWKRHKSPLCLAIWDIDYFKTINDKYGHGVGDRVLQLFADIIQSRVRKVDFFARIGGEEFILLMPDTPIDMALMLNNKLRTMLEDCNFHYEGKHIHITSSVGISEFQEGDKAISALERADHALYQSKHDGRNRCTVFDKEM